MRVGVALLAAAVPATPQNAVQSQRAKERWLSAQQAAKLVGREVVEVFAPEIRRSMHAQLFRPGPFPSDSVLIMNRRAYSLGVGLGGYGLTSFCVADQQRDGVPELYTTSSWGSGLHRAELWAVSRKWGTKPVRLNGSLKNRDWVLRKAKDGSVALYLAKITRWDSNCDLKKLSTLPECQVGLKVGTVCLKTVDGKPVLNVLPVPGLRDDIKRELWLVQARTPSGERSAGGVPKPHAPKTPR